VVAAVAEAVTAELVLSAEALSTWCITSAVLLRVVRVCTSVSAALESLANQHPLCCDTVLSHCFIAVAA
jgi:hypothetical protein